MQFTQIVFGFYFCSFSRKCLLVPDGRRRQMKSTTERANETTQFPVMVQGSQIKFSDGWFGQWWVWVFLIVAGKTKNFSVVYLFSFIFLASKKLGWSGEWNGYMRSMYGLSCWAQVADISIYSYIVSCRDGWRRVSLFWHAATSLNFFFLLYLTLVQSESLLLLNSKENCVNAHWKVIFCCLRLCDVVS